MTQQPLTADDIKSASQEERDELVKIVNTQLLNNREYIEEGGSAYVSFDRTMTNRLQKALEELYFDWNIRWEHTRVGAYWSLK